MKQIDILTKKLKVWLGLISFCNFFYLCQVFQRIGSLKNILKTCRSQIRRLIFCGNFAAWLTWHLPTHLKLMNYEMKTNFMFVFFVMACTKLCSRPLPTTSIHFNPLPSTPIPSHSLPSSSTHTYSLPLNFNPLSLIFSHLPPTLTNFQSASAHSHSFPLCTTYL